MLPCNSITALLMLLPGLAAPVAAILVGGWSILAAAQRGKMAAPSWKIKLLPVFLLAGMAIMYLLRSGQCVVP